MKRNTTLIILVVILMLILCACGEQESKQQEIQHEDLRIVFLENSGAVTYYETAYNRPIYEFLDRESIQVNSDSDLRYVHRQRWWKVDSKGVDEFEHRLYDSKNIWLTEDIVIYHKDVDKELLERTRRQYERTKE